MKKKNIFFTFILIFLISIFNVLYKYILVQENLSNITSSFGSAFVTTSNIKPPYNKIFILSLISVIIMTVVLEFVLYYLNSKKIKRSIIFNKISNYLPIIICTATAIGIIFVNKIISLIILFVGIITYLYFIYKNNNKKSFITVLLVTVAEILVLYLISK